jgi:hypothetical protein
MEMTQYRGLKGSGLADVSSVYPSWAAPDSTGCPYAPYRMYCISMCIWAERLNMVGLRYQSLSSLIEAPLSVEVQYSTRHSASCLFKRAHKIILCCVAGEAPSFPAHPPQGGWPGGQLLWLPTRPSYLSFHPSRATMHKSYLPPIPILSYCCVALLFFLCSLLVPLCGVGTRAVQQRPPRRERATAYPGKQS